MSKKILAVIAFFVFAFSITTSAQSKKYPISRAVAEKMLTTVPVQDGRIVFEETIPTSLSKAEISQKLAQWFEDSFAEDKSTIDVNDAQKFAAKVAWKYKNVSGMLVNTGLVTASVNITFNDGNLKLEISDLKSNESTNGLTGLASTGVKGSYDLNEVLAEHNTKKTKFTTRQLDNMNHFAYYVEMSLKDLLK